jgi:hypothetical protein
VRSREVANQSAGRVLVLVDAAACVDQHQLVAGIYQDGVELQPTGLHGWNVDVRRPLASSARSPHSVSAGNETVPSLTTVISMVPSLKR